MSSILPRLRVNLDFMPSPVADRPGLLIRDPYGYSDITLIIPPLLVQCLDLFDGASTDLDLRARLLGLTGELRSGEVVDQLSEALGRAGFLEDETYAESRRRRHAEFAGAAVREAAHAGAAYPEEAAALRTLLDAHLDGDGPSAGAGLVGLAAPHVSFDGAWDCYRDAYGALGPESADRIFVILGTSHFGEPARFGLTRKPFATPFGKAATEVGLVDELARRAPGAVVMEDYCHSFEHSIEFQVIFLQHLCGPRVRILPVLCGSYGQSLLDGGKPEDDANVARFLDALGGIAAREGRRLFWVLGIDMAHMGRRYGDPFAAEAGKGRMADVAGRDRARIERLSAADAAGFWDLVRQNRDDLKWCGASPLYTFMRVYPQARAELVRYQQWNIDPESVVSFSALHFFARQD